MFKVMINEIFTYFVHLKTLPKTLGQFPLLPVPDIYIKYRFLLFSLNLNTNPYYYVMAAMECYPEEQSYPLLHCLLSPSCPYSLYHLQPVIEQF